MDEARKPFSHSEHMATMFALYLATRPVAGLLNRRVTVDDLRGVFNVGYVEGMWSERVHPGGLPSRRRRREARDGAGK